MAAEQQDKPVKFGLIAELPFAGLPTNAVKAYRPPLPRLRPLPEPWVPPTGKPLGRGEEETAVRRGNAVALMLNGSTRTRTALNDLDGQ